MAKKLLHTKLCDVLGIQYPLLLAGMGEHLFQNSPLRSRMLAGLAFLAQPHWDWISCKFTHSTRKQELYSQ